MNTPKDQAKPYVLSLPDLLACWREAWRRQRAFRAAWSGLRPNDRARYTDARWHTSGLRMSSFANIHAGRRAFIIGNGPSLAQMDLSPLRHEITFGLNRIYLMFDRLGFKSTYHVVCNRLVIKQCAAELDALTMPQFLNWRARDHVSFTPNKMFIFDPYDGSLGFSRNPADLCWEGATVTYLTMQLAFHMGITDVILIGVDHNFVTQGQPNQVVVSEGDDPNHFAPDYFGKGFRWQLPDLEVSELCYRLARHQFEKADRRIVDATVGGKLTVFPKIRFEDLFAESGQAARKGPAL